MVILIDVIISGPILPDHILPASLPWWQGCHKECQALSTDGPGGKLFPMSLFKVIKVFSMYVRKIYYIDKPSCLVIIRLKMKTGD